MIFTFVAVFVLIVAATSMLGNIPDVVGDIVEKQDYFFKIHQMQITHSNTFFLERFGRNDFEELSQYELKYGNTLNQITKQNVGACSGGCKQYRVFTKVSAHLLTWRFEYGISPSRQNKVCR